MSPLTDHLYTSLGTISNYIAVADLHILQVTKAPAKPCFQPALPSSTVPLQRLLTVETLQLHALRFYLHKTEISTNSW
jgi:hypothetical protein